MRRSSAEGIDFSSPMCDQGNISHVTSLLLHVSYLGYIYARRLGEQGAITLSGASGEYRCCSSPRPHACYTAAGIRAHGVSREVSRWLARHRPWTGAPARQLHVRHPFLGTGCLDGRGTQHNVLRRPPQNTMVLARQRSVPLGEGLRCYRFQ
jgi:hypothetical protein